MSSGSDPKWTAFVLGELETLESNSVREELERDTSAIENVEQLREISALIRESLTELSPLELTSGQREAILAGDMGPSRKHWFQKFGRNWWVLAATAAVVILAAGLVTVRMRRVAPLTKPEKSPMSKTTTPGMPEISQNAAPVIPKQLAIVLLDRSGKMVSEIAPPGMYYGFRVSPDGRQLIVEMLNEPNSRDVWVVDLASRKMTRLTFGGGSSPVWSPDGRLITFTDPATSRIYRINANGSGFRAALTNDGTPLDWSPNSQLIMFQKGSQPSLWILSSSGGVPAPFSQTPYSNAEARFSPDGRWVAYTSDETGRQEIYVRSFPSAPAKYQTSTDGGVSPRWSPDEREIFYITPAGQLMSVAFAATADSVRFGRAAPLFQLPSPDATQFEVTPDGRGFIVLEAPKVNKD